MLRDNSLPQDPKESRWLNEHEVALLTGRALQTLRNERSQGRGICCSKAGWSVRYPLRAVMDFMESHLVRVEAV
jgi:hypothetical protein